MIKNRPLGARTNLNRKVIQGTNNKTNNVSVQKTANTPQQNINQLQKEIEAARILKERYEKRRLKATQKDDYKRVRAAKSQIVGLNKKILELQKFQKEISTGKNYSVNEVISYSNDVRNYYQNKRSNSKPKKITATTLKIDDKVITGFADEKGNFVANSTSDKTFRAIKKKYGTKNNAILREIGSQQPINKTVKRQSGAIQKKLAQISLRKDLNTIEKEELKRELLGIDNPKQQKVSKNKVIKGSISKGNPSLIGKLTTPSTNDSNAKLIAKGVGSAVYEGAIALSTLAALTYKTANKDAKAAQQLKNMFTWENIKNSGDAMGKQIQSNNVFERTKGMVSFASFFVGVKLPTGSPKVVSAASKFSTITNDISKASKTVIQQQGTLSNGKLFKQVTTLRANPKNKRVYGNAKTTIAGKTKTTKVEYVDKGTYYLDKSTGKRISKNQYVPSQIDYKVTSTKFQQSKPTELRVNGNTAFYLQQKAVSKTVTKGRISNKKKVEVTKSTKSDVQFSVSEKAKVLDAMGFGTSKTVKSTKGRSVSKKPIDNTLLQNFLKEIDYDKAIINGIDKRTRVARALGLRKGKKLDSVIRKLDSLTIVKSTSKAKGIISKTTKVTKKKSSLSSNIGKKGSFEAILKQKKLSKSVQRKYLAVPRSIDIPDLKVRISQVKSLKARGLLPVMKSQTVLKSLEEKLNALNLKNGNKTVPKKTPVTKTTPKNKNMPLTANKTKKALKTINKPMKPASSPKTTKTTFGKGKQPKPIPTKKPLTFDSKLPAGQRLTFDVRVRRNGRVFNLGVKLPKNEALARLNKELGNNIAASGDLVISGTTTKKDVKAPNMSKYRTAKTKKVLKVVEKSKYRIDSPGEKKALKRAKAKKPKKKTSKKTKKLKKKK